MLEERKYGEKARKADSVMVWACIAASGAGILTFSNNLAFDRSNRADAEVHRSILCTQSQRNTSNSHIV